MSSFTYLKNLPVDYLKIDGSFVTTCSQDPVDHAMVEAIHRIGHIMGKKTIAESVESRRCSRRCAAIGVDYAQGFAMRGRRSSGSCGGRTRCRAALRPHDPAPGRRIARISRRSRVIARRLSHRQFVGPIPRYAAPWFLLFDAAAEFMPTMTPEDLQRAGLDRLGKPVGVVRSRPSTGA